MRRRWMAALGMVGLSIVLAMVGCGDDEAEAPGLILDVGSQLEVTAGQDVVLIHLTATNTQGGALDFEVVDAPERATFQDYENSAVFRWDPLISDVTEDEPHQVGFRVTNDAGLSAEKRVAIGVNSGDEASRFVSDSSLLYDASSEEPMVFDVEVYSREAALVILEMEEAPQGAVFEQVEDFEGRVEWLPSASQRQERRHRFVFSADLGDRDIEQVVTVVMQRPVEDDGAGECEFEEVISHQPLEAARSIEPFEVVAQVEELTPAFDEGLLLWTTDDPRSSSADVRTELMEVVEGQARAEIPNPLVTTGESSVVSYQICLFSDAPGAEGIACAPGEEWYRFVVYGPDQGECLPGEAEAPLFDHGEWREFQSCSDSPGVHAVELEEGMSGEAQIALSPWEGEGARVDVTLDGEPLEVERESCRGMITALVEGPGALQVRVVGEDLPYHIRLDGADEKPDTPECVDTPGQYSTPGDAQLVFDDFAVFEGRAICDEDDRDIYALELLRGDIFDAYMWFDHDQGDLDMTFYGPGQSGDIEAGGSGLAQGWSSDDDESIVTSAEESGIHYLSVVTSSTANQYDLMLSRSCEVDDEFAGNHSLAQAAQLGSGNSIEATGLKACSGQSDFFVLPEGGAGGTQWLGEFTPREGEGAVDIGVYEGSGGLIDIISGDGGGVDLSMNADSGEAMMVEVAPDGDVIYDLYFEGF